MAWAQKAMDLGVWRTLRPLLAKNHWRFASTKEIAANGMAKIELANSTRRSKWGSLGWSTTPYLSRIRSRWASSTGTG